MQSLRGYGLVRSRTIAPPLLRADTSDVLAKIGYDEAKLEELKKQKIV
jgi:crotonobetainyl-CoA:carnitine CoA-transferase CaiB-like acyl-CoA transferase